MQISTLIIGITITIIPSGLILPELGVKCGGNIGGYYSQHSESIYVCAGENVEFYTNHELGHKFWFEHMTPMQRYNYRKMWRQSMEEGSGSFFRDYGMKTEIEDFADNFSLMILNSNQPPKIQKRIRWIKKVFKNG